VEKCCIMVNDQRKLHYEYSIKKKKLSKFIQIRYFY
jgi:hypothetical protein